MENKKKLAFVLKNIRLERGMSLREFGDFLGISHAYLSKLEKGFDSSSGKEIAPTIDVLAKIAGNLEIPVEEFLERCGYFEPVAAVAAEDTVSCRNVNLNELLEEMLHTIKNAGRLTYEGRELTRAEGEMIAEAIEISVELARRRL